MQRKTILSGMRPTGRLHIGHLSVLENWVKLQEENDCYFMVADWHAITTAFENTEQIAANTRELVLDWLAAGLDPEKAAIFVQSKVQQHAELHLVFSMITPISWLERVPTYKDQIQQFGDQGKDINTYGFLGYPLLQAADILIYLADAVPIGQDQLPHLELTREVGRRFNYLYQTQLFPEPQAILGEVPLLPGLDGRKMSKSYGNDISMVEEPESLWQKIRQMVTDPARVRRQDPGNPDVCVVYTYQKIYNPAAIVEIAEGCRTAGIGCIDCKKQLAERLNEVMTPLRERRRHYSEQAGLVEEVLAAGRDKASRKAEATMQRVREALKF